MRIFSALSLALFLLFVIFLYCSSSLLRAGKRVYYNFANGYLLCAITELRFENEENSYTQNLLKGGH